MSKMSGYCVCQICTCGRHRCPHNRGSIGQYPVKAECNFTEYKTAFERWAFQPPRKSLRPPLNAHTSSVPMDVSTVYQDTYTKHQHKNKIVKAKQEYCPSDKKMEVLSTYARDYTSTGQTSVRTDSYKPENSYVPATAKFHNDTMYRVSFKNHSPDDWEWCRASPIKHKECINIDSSFEHNVTSTMKEDFTKHEKPERAKLVRPTQETQQPSGKFDGKTTYKSEYTGKPTSATTSYNPRKQYTAHGAAFHGESTTKSAYKPHVKVKREQSYKPQMEYKPTSSRFEGQTTSSDAYKVWPVTKPEKPSWAKKKAFEAPVDMFSKNSSYQDDFKKPSKHQRAALANPGGQVPLNVFREGGPGKYNTRTQYQEHFVEYSDTLPSKSFKAIQSYEPPKEKVAGESTYRGDYKGDATEQAKMCRPHEDMPREVSAREILKSTYHDTYKGVQPVNCPAQKISDFSSQANKKNDVSVGTTAGDYKLIAVHEGHHIYKNKSNLTKKTSTPRKTAEATRKPPSRPGSAAKQTDSSRPRPSSGRKSADHPGSTNRGSGSRSRSASRPRPPSAKARPESSQGRNADAPDTKGKMAAVC